MILYELVAFGFSFEVEGVSRLGAWVLELFKEC